MKKQTRKLRLNRETLRNLGDDQSRRVVGGLTGRPGCNDSQVVACTTQSAFCTRISVCVCPTDIDSCAGTCTDSQAVCA